MRTKQCGCHVYTRLPETVVPSSASAAFVFRPEISGEGEGVLGGGGGGGGGGKSLFVHEPRNESTLEKQHQIQILSNLSITR